MWAEAEQDKLQVAFDNMNIEFNRERTDRRMASYNRMSSEQDEDAFEDLHATVSDQQSAAGPRPEAASSALSGQPSSGALSEVWAELLMAPSVLGSYCVRFLVLLSFSTQSSKVSRITRVIRCAIMT